MAQARLQSVSHSLVPCETAGGVCGKAVRSTVPNPEQNLANCDFDVPWRFQGQLSTEEAKKAQEEADRMNAAVSHLTVVSLSTPGSHPAAGLAGGGCAGDREKGGNIRKNLNFT